jgi:hypothetical protein
MAEVLLEYSDSVMSKDGRMFSARACGSEMDDSRWQGWIEFRPSRRQSTDSVGSRNDAAETAPTPRTGRRA